MMGGKLPISVIITTYNEAQVIAACLDALADFDEVIVVDSHSEDQTAAIATQCGATVLEYVWNGQYPKKRGWCLSHVVTRHEWVFFVDADEIVTPALVTEIRSLWQTGAPACAGYFVKGQYVLNGQFLRFGMQNNKLCLLRRDLLEFPVVDDLDCPGMGEIEGHYQPVLKMSAADMRIGQVHASLEHHAFYDHDKWIERHKRYAAWERSMDQRKAWPCDVSARRRFAKKLFRALPSGLKGALMFAYSYVFKLGVFDGRNGFIFAKSRWDYYAHY